MLKLTELIEDDKIPLRYGGPQEPSITDLTARVLRELREISTGLVLPHLDELTATEAVWLAVKQHEDVTGTAVDCQISELPDGVARSLKICLYRIVQEGLNNAFHHAKANGQRVEASTDGRSIVVAVSDSGPGFSVEEPDRSPKRTGLGLAGLRSRIEAFKGKFELLSQRGTGTRLRAELPIARSSV
jgi:signal transduction histidine kinase